MNFDYTENGGKKSLSCKSRINIMYPNMENMITVPNHKKNGDYYENPSLIHFTDELWLQGKWWNEKLFVQIQSINIVYPNVESMIVVPNHKKNVDYYDNQGLTHLMDKLWL